MKSSVGWENKFFTMSMMVLLMSFVMACTTGNGPTPPKAYNEIFVANYYGANVMVFSRTADGAATPLRTITGAELVSTGDITGLV